MITKAPTPCTHPYELFEAKFALDAFLRFEIRFPKFPTTQNQNPFQEPN